MALERIDRAQRSGARGPVAAGPGQRRRRSRPNRPCRMPRHRHCPGRPDRGRGPGGSLWINTQERTSLPTGAVKTHLGHLESAAGVAGMIKAALCLYAAVYPGKSPFRATQSTYRSCETQRLPWPAKQGTMGKPRPAALCGRQLIQLRRYQRSRHHGRGPDGEPAARDSRPLTCCQFRRGATRHSRRSGRTLPGRCSVSDPRSSRLSRTWPTRRAFAAGITIFVWPWWGDRGQSASTL